MIEGRKNEVRIRTENQAGIVRRKQVGIVIEGIVVTVGGIMIVVAEIVIGTMIEIVDMIASVIGILIATEVMIQEVTAGHARGQRNVQEIMIATGVMIGTRRPSLRTYNQKCVLV